MNDVVTHKCVVLVAVGERHESLQIMLPRNELANPVWAELRVAIDIAKVRGEMKVFLCVADYMHLIHVQLGNLGLRE